MSQEYENFDVVTAKNMPHSGVQGPVLVVRGQEEGAIPTGSFVAKCNSNEGDSYPDGTVGIVISSFLGEDDLLVYQVIFACDHPLPAVIAAERIMEIPPPQVPEQ